MNEKYAQTVRRIKSYRQMVELVLHHKAWPEDAWQQVGHDGWSPGDRDDVISLLTKVRTRAFQEDFQGQSYGFKLR